MLFFLNAEFVGSSFYSTDLQYSSSQVRFSAFPARILLHSGLAIKRLASSLFYGLYCHREQGIGALRGKQANPETALPQPSS
jgi:hypothetical protein